MAELTEKIHTALGETRMLILGSQILLGFQFRGVFQDSWDQLPKGARSIDGVALILMLAAVAFLIAPGMHHQIVEDGEDTARIHRLISLMAGLALLPFAVSIGLDLFIVVERIYGPWVAVPAGGGFSALALFFWYGLELLHRRNFGGKERAMSAQRQHEVKQTPLHNKIEQMLVEARVILPGAQALLGFQLAIVLTQSFETLQPSSQLIHAISLGLVALTTILLMAPAAYHRIVYEGEDSENFHRTGSALVTAATLPLALGLGCDVYVVMTKVAASPLIGGAIAGLTVTGLVGLWHIYPLVARHRHTGRHPSGGSDRQRAGGS